ncbi:unnamed protein product, partial [Mesorhabditis spiculigera]
MRYLLPLVQAIILSSAVKRLNHKKCHAEVSDEFRWTALYRMNFYREMLAQGMAPNKTGMLPGAKNMYKLLYDCALEDISYKVTSVCASNLKYDPNGIIYGAPSSAPKSAASAPDYLSETISDHVRDTQYDGLAADVKVDWYTTYWTMKYNCEAEKSAHEWAAQCQVAHSSNRNKTGENLYFKFDNQQEPGAALTAAMQQWWGELAQYGVGPEPNLTDSVWQRGVGHYTQASGGWAIELCFQMAWQETTEVGCAWAHCPDFTYVVCHYKPAGNYMNELIYERGTPCQTDADCGSGRTCLVDEALCQV